ncbi:MAG: hypothetical protein Q8Q26_12555 [Pseudorhodobacter sp.]|nr:hypothetical protein [Pseudorhodobacter sp.]
MAMIDPDLALVSGLGLAALAIPSLAAAYADRRPPWLAVVLLVTAAALVVLAIMAAPQGYALHDVPQVFYDVIGRVLN